MKKDRKKERLKELELVAYGCNRRVFQEISAFLSDERIYSFTFYEYFCVEPYAKEKLNSNSEIEVELLCPFTKRYAIGVPLLPMKVRKRNRDIIVVREKREKDKLKDFYEPFTVKFSHRENFNGKDGDTLKVIKNWINGDYKYWKEKGEEDFFDYLRSNEIGRKREFAIVNVIWWEYLKLEESKKLLFIYVPIASKNVFYGELLLIVDSGDITYSTQSEEEICDLEKLNKIIDKLYNIASGEYLPLLIIFENYCLEKENSENYTENSEISSDSRNIFLEGIDESDSCTNELEKIFKSMWKRRETYKEENENELLVDSFIMNKYLIASPGMINRVREAITLNPSDSGKSYLPCVLIVGGPGTGKEKMARLIAKYSEDFCSAKIYTINMASLQPKQLSGPLLVGIESGKFFMIKGLLEKIIVESGKNEPVVMIFDELNSLDIDSQGVLLRLIENREFCRIGGLAEKKVKERLEKKKILIIGLMNENPEVLTKLTKIHSISSDKEIFGGLIGEVLYEYVRNLRRLRDDLYYRMKRNAVIDIPELYERPEDLPFLFYNFLIEELEELCNKEYASNGMHSFSGSNVVVDYESFEVLMDSSIKWSGNIRQLQSVVKSVAKQLRLTKLLDETVVIGRVKIIKALIENDLINE